MAVYLIHFERPFKHAKHYTGYADDVPKRLERHRSGAGARLLRAVQAAGIGWEVAQVWPDGDKTFERKLKKQGGASRHCPVCKQASKDALTKGKS